MQRHILRFLVCLVSCSALTGSFAQIADDFTDGDFTTGTVWNGNTALFVVVDDGGNQRLRSNNPGAANYYLSTPSELVDDAQWELFIDLRFATSGANYADIYFMSNAADLTSGVNGYFVRMGGTSDRIELFRSDAGTNTSLAVQSPDAVVNSSTSNPFRIKVTRSAVGLFTLYFDDGNTGTYTTAGLATDATYSSASHFGIRVEQSTAASAVNNHFFDDINAQLIPVDNTPPTLLSATALDATHVDLLFSEPLQSGSVIPTVNYQFNPADAVFSATLQAPSTVHLTMTVALQENVPYSVTVNGVLDLAGNAASNTSANFTWTVADLALPGEVVINEIMADQSPPVGLPEAEFVEILNTSTTKTFDLTGWTFGDGSTTATLPAATLPPGAYAIVVDDATAPLFNAYPNVIVVTSFPSMNNDGDALELKRTDATTIDAVTYALAWYQDAVKAQGGWTLERINPMTPCSSAENWIASNDVSGGTPSEQNSVYSNVGDNAPPTLLGVQVNDANNIVLVFSEAMDAASMNAGTYTITPTISITSAVTIGTASVQLVLADALALGTSYQVAVTNVTDCPGNAIAGNNTGSFALPEAVLPGDVVINEVLYDPVVGGSDFVELYNRSAKALSLANWKLANVTNGVVGSEATITPSSFLLLPGQYVLITESAQNIATVYPQSHTDRFIEANMPSYNNGNGSVVLEGPDGTLLDRFDYDDALHFALVNKTEGYSLERVDPDRPTSDNTNWQTASDVSGRATPGFRNSEYSPTASASGEMTIEPSIFSPDNDGFQDLLTMVYHFDQAGFVGNLSVYDIAGREIRHLMENQLLGTDGAISWDGILDDNSKGRMGAYIVMLEVFDLSGNTERYKKTVTLAHKLN